MRRRDVFSVLALSAAAAQTSPPGGKGRLKQCVTDFVFDRNMRFEDRCRVAASLGCKGYDMVQPSDWPTLKKYGLICSLYPWGPGGTIYNALSNRGNHSRLEPLMHAAIDESAANGVPSIITYSGTRNGMDDRQGMDNCMAFLGRVKTHAEDKGVTICIEYLNSKVNHPDYLFDHYAWGVELCRRVDSPCCKILWDIYHAQIMDGDIVRNIRDNF
jgi:hydroxypyruvate isomerase